MIDRILTFSKNKFAPFCFILSLLFIIGHVLINSQGFIYDEPIHLSNLDIIKKEGLGANFIKKINGLVGPLYSYVHYSLESITQRDVVRTRLVNVFFSIFISFSLYKTLSQIDPDKKKIAFLFFCIPMSFPTVGMALSEIPAMLFFSMGLFFIVFFYNKQEKQTCNYILFLLTALLFSLAIAGRQPYASCIGAFIIIFCYFKKDYATIIATCIFVLISLLYPAYLFTLWGGLVPESDRAVATSHFLTPQNLVFALGYSFFVMAILSYTFFIKLDKKYSLFYCLAFLCMLLICYTLNISFIPMRTISAKIIPIVLLSSYGYLMAGVIGTLGLFFTYSLFVRMYERRGTFLFNLFSLMLLAILFSCTRVAHQFSSRYIMQAAPLFLIIATYYYRESFWQRVLHVTGVGLGVLSLMSYY